MEQQPFIQNNYKQENNFQIIDNKNKPFKLLFIAYQIFLWIILIITLINRKYFVVFIIVYIIYIILEFCSYTSRFLLNKKSTNSIYNKLKEIFNTFPVLKISCECYHFEKHLEERKDKDGKIITEEVTKRINTYNGSEYFNIYSYRDISGLFKIDLNSEIFKNKNYIKLTLDTIINFAEPISFSDYQNFKNNFINKNRYKDQKMDIKEESYIPNLTKNNLIKIKDKEPFYINFFYFFICVILTMGVPYQIIFDNISIEGKYQIKKVISTRYNLNSVEYDNIYGMYIPAIKLGINEFNFIPDDYGFINKDVEVNFPTLEEIENASKYKEQIKNPFSYNNNCAPTPVDLPTEEEINQKKIE